MNTRSNLTTQTYLLGGMLLVTVATMFLLIMLQPLKINHDSALYLEVGGFLLDGRLPYVDYVEMNPPFIHYLHILPAWIARQSGLNPISVYLILVAGLSTLSILSVFWLLKSGLPDVDILSVHLIPIVLALFNLDTLTTTTFGEREHLLLMLVFPGIILRWLRWEERYHAGYIPAFIIGAFAGAGVLIKPYYLLALILPEIYWLVIHRRITPIFKPEVFAVVSVGILFLLHFLIIPQESSIAFFREIVPAVAFDYAAYGNLPLMSFLTVGAPLLAVVILPLVFLMVYRRQIVIWHLVPPLALFTLASFMVLVFQRKGWAYHAIPFFAGVRVVGILASVTTRVFPAEGLTPQLSARRSKLSILVLLFFVALSLTRAVLVINQSPAIEMDFADVVLQRTNEYDGVLVIDTSVNPAFPTLMQINRHMVASYPVAFPVAFALNGISDIAALYDVEQPVPDQLRRYLDLTKEDIAQQKPALVLIRKGPCQACPTGFDIARYLTAIGFTQDYILTEYQPVADLNYELFEVYQRIESN